MSTANSKQLFRKLLSLQGSTIDVGVRSTGEQMRGLLVNVMFDSFLVQTASETKVVAFDDILYADAVDAAA